MKRTRISSVVLALGLAMVLATSVVVSPSAGDRATPGEDALANLSALAAGNTAFALALYHALQGDGENLFFSPLSVSMALGMVSAGARGETLTQIEDALRFGLGQDALHPAFNALDWLLESRQVLPYDRGEGFTLNMVNSIWGQTGYDFLPEYLDLLASSYGAGLRPTDYASDPEAARQAINAWVEEATHDRIRELIKPGHISSATLLTLVNAVYFNAPWAYPFDKEDTTPEPFTLLDGVQVDVPTMHQTERHGYAVGDGYTAVELDYNGNDLSMVIVLPDEGAFVDVEAGLDPAFLAGLIDGLARERVILSLPRFTFEWGKSVNDPLADLGMVDAFDGRQADFSGIDGTHDLFIGLVIHKAFVAVDEAGTEAAAATAVVMAGGAPQTQPKYYEVRVDRPFLFFIREKETSSILFIGRVVDPR